MHPDLHSKDCIIDDDTYETYRKYIPRNTALATTTRYPSIDGIMTAEHALRAALAKCMFEKAIQTGYALVIVDSGSDAGWLQEMKDLGAHISREKQYTSGKHAIGKSKRQALLEAGMSGRNLIQWLEPEKHNYINAQNCQDPAVIAGIPIIKGDTDIVIPQRRDNLASYPVQQYHAEIASNLTLASLFGEYLVNKGIMDKKSDLVYLDLAFGPRVMNHKSLDYFVNYAGEFGDRWESIYIPVWQAIIDGLRVRSVGVDYLHPQEQTRYEESRTIFGLKRIEQLTSIITAAKNMMKYHYENNDEIEMDATGFAPMTSSL
jgi:hypothetical protein